MKRYVYIFIAIFIFMLTPLVCDAALCNKTRYSELQDKVKKVEITWDFKTEGDEKNYIFSFENVDKNIMVYFGDKYYEPDENGKITINAGVIYGSSYGFKFYGGYDSDCVEEYLNTKNINVTKYNDYSEKEECKDNEDFELCKELYDGEIKDDEEFEKKLDDYKRETKIKKILLYTGITIVVAFIIICLSKSKRMKGNSGKNEK